MCELASKQPTDHNKFYQPGLNPPALKFLDQPLAPKLLNWAWYCTVGFFCSCFGNFYCCLTTDGLLGVL